MQTVISWHEHRVERQARAAQKNQRPCVLWFTGLSGAGKSTLANEVEQCLFRFGHHSFLLDGDNIRHGLNRDLGFSDGDRAENIRRVGEVAKLMTDAGLIVLSAFISPFHKERESVRQMFAEGEFIEVYVDAPLETCERRDPKGLYRRARAGEIRNFTGVDSVYEPPLHPEIHLRTHLHSASQCAERIVQQLKLHGYLRSYPRS
ncbi:adenylyl-sulfate kinase [Reinekea sp. G2M2-21]|uniref:adenylyl-sulfate kinase n=1 Tax=Reinekea sp. G2M2-21 TaxID=2788942 RepID=UPI0018AC8CD3|nr:adenylyl-sulfate kinase [Reinekea sp. G2M2-21]